MSSVVRASSVKRDIFLPYLSIKALLKIAIEVPFRLLRFSLILPLEDLA